MLIVYNEALKMSTKIFYGVVRFVVKLNATPQKIIEP